MLVGLAQVTTVMGYLNRAREKTLAFDEART